MFLFISSENSNKSDWTSREIAAANELHKKIIPFRYDRSPYDDSVMLYLATLDRVDYFRNPDTAIRSLVEAIHRQLDEIQKEEIRKKREEEERKRREEEQRRRAEELASVSRELTVLGQKRNELADDIDAASKSLEGKNARLKEMDASLETLRSRQAKLLGMGNEEPKPQPKPADNVFTRGWEDIQRHWRSNPMLVNVFVVLAICALAYLIFYLYGSTLSSYAKSIKTPQGKRSFSYEYAFMVGSVLASAWGVVKLLRKDAIGYIYVVVPASALSVAYLLGKTSKQFATFYSKLCIVCGIIVLVSLAILVLRKGKAPFWSMLHFKLVETLKDWRYLAVWGLAIILLVLFVMTLWHFHGVWL